MCRLLPISTGSFTKSATIYNKNADLEQIHGQLNGLTVQLSKLQQKTQQLAELLTAVKAVSDQNAIDSGHYKRAIAACIRVLNGATGERLGLDTGVRNDYPFPKKEISV